MRGASAGLALRHIRRARLSALFLLRQCLGVSDAELVNQIAENPYLGFFIGCKSFDESCPFVASILVAFRKRFSEDEVKRINNLVVTRTRAAAAESEKADDDGSIEGGALAMDATGAPSNITHIRRMRPCSTSATRSLRPLLTSSAPKQVPKKPRMYRQRPRHDFLNWSNAKRRSYRLNRRSQTTAWVRLA